MGTRRLDDLGRRPVGGQHDRAAGWHKSDVVDENDPELAEAVDHDLVVDDLVVAVNGRFEDPHHPGERLDRHLHPGTEPPWRSQQYLFDFHAIPSYRLRA